MSSVFNINAIGFKKLHNLSLNNIKDETPSLYIYNVDTTTKDIPKLKIGYALNTRNRIKAFKQISKTGKLEFAIKLASDNIRIDEKYIHNLLAKYRIKDEMFQVNVETAKLIILYATAINTLLPNDEEVLVSKLRIIYDHNNNIINDILDPKIFTNTISTQTDNIEFKEEQTISMVYSKDFKDQFKNLSLI